MDNNLTVVAVDAMGGDNAPLETIKGCVAALSELNVKILLVGKEEIINEELSKFKYDKDRLEVINATEVIGTDESPTKAFRKKKDSSMVVGLNLVKNGIASGFVSAGSTGALLTGSTVIIGRIKGVERPALGTCLPTTKGFTMLIDSGANVDCKPNYLLQFAQMGSVYMEKCMNVKNPKVGLVNIGVEEEKGNSLTKSALELLKSSKLNFCGNVEAREIPFGEADVIVCDGFVGNVILKYSEGLSSGLFSIIKSEITKGMYKIGAGMLKTPFKNIKERFDPEEIGGAPFLGLKGLVVKVHGSSKEKGFKNAIKQCVIFANSNILSVMEENIKIEKEEK